MEGESGYLDLLTPVIHGSLNWIALIDPQGVIVDFNPAAERAFGYSRAEMVGRRITDFAQPNRERVEEERTFIRMISGKEDLTGTRLRVDGILPDGRTMPLEATVTEVAGAGRRLFLCTFRDVSYERQHREQLQESRWQLELAIDAAKLGTWTFDLDSNTTWYSDRSKEMYGVPPGVEIDVRTLKQMVHPDDWLAVARPYLEGFLTDRVEVEYRVMQPDGSLRWIHSLGAARRDESGVARTVHGIHLDITDRKRAEAELARSREALHQSEKLAALGSLLAGVSHELNNPLSAIVGQAQMLEEDGRGTAFEDRAKKISAAAERCARIVQTFLAMARRKEPQRRPVDPNALVSASLRLSEYGLRTAGINVATELEPGLPLIEGDQDQLHQVLINLIINAQQALETGGGAEKRLCIRTASTVDRVHIEIRDNGPGIDPETAARVFEPFFTTKPQGSGTGVGLSFSQGIIEAHGGELRLVPSEAGAAFIIDLPIGVPVEMIVAEPVTSAARSGTRGNVLVVDDEEDVAETLAELLVREGFSVSKASDGRAALEALSAGTFALILSDLRMPGLGGPDFYARMIAAYPEMAARIAFVTGDTMGPSMSAFLESCGRPVLEKPFTVETVRALLAAMLPVEPNG